jgi:hypothetical protein
LEFKVEYASGKEEWLNSHSFFDDDGTVTESLLEYCNSSQLTKVLNTFTAAKLQTFLAGQNLKATGSKSKRVKRVVKHYARVKRGTEFTESRLLGKLGPISHGEDSISGIIRRFYTNNYSALDRFDKYWYSIAYPTHSKDWEVHFTFSLLHQAVVNTFVAYCKLQERCIPILDFVELLINEYVSSLHPSA